MDGVEFESRVLAVKRKQRLEWNENEMQKAAKAVASSLKDIHDNKLYVDSYGSFEEYCEKRWGISRRRGYQIIGAQNTRLMLGDAVKDDPVATEALEAMSGRAVMELKATEEPVKVLKDLSKTGKRITTGAIKKIFPSAREICPTCKRPI